ncbi:MAG: HD domain-containing protein [Lachnospiraceae bacterium]|nr:HD domain-containing protein [Lachnospiraceae bacterium]
MRYITLDKAKPGDILMSDQELADLVNAAILHDFGKMKIPMEILNKKERLTGEEYDIMRSHVKLSYEMIKDKNDHHAGGEEGGVVPP